MKACNLVQNEKDTKLLKPKNKKKQEEATDETCNLQCPQWKEGQSGAPPILPAVDLPPQDPTPCLPTSKPLRYSYITDSSLLQSTIKTQEVTFSFGFVGHHRSVTSSCCLSFLPLVGSHCVHGRKRNRKRKCCLVSGILGRWQVEGWGVNYEYSTYSN
jgi:hypothetical protein